MSKLLTSGAMLLGAIAQGLALTGRVVPAIVAGLNGVTWALVALSYRSGYRFAQGGIIRSPATNTPASVPVQLSADQAVRMPVPPWKDQP